MSSRLDRFPLGLDPSTLTPYKTCEARVPDVFTILEPKGPGIVGRRQAKLAANRRGYDATENSGLNKRVVKGERITWH